MLLLEAINTTLLSIHINVQIQRTLVNTEGTVHPTMKIVIVLLPPICCYFCFSTEDNECELLDTSHNAFIHR